MKNLSNLLTAFTLLILVGLTSCSDDDNNDVTPENQLGTLNMEFTGLPDLGSDYAYEGWIIVDGAPVTAGIFNVDENGNPDKTSFLLDAAQLDRATAYALTIEPVPDNDPAPSKVHILAGDFNDKVSDLNTEHPLAIGTNFLDAKGSYLLGTPTDGSLETDETSGIWWEDLSTGTPLPSLTLPTLLEGWEYEGWVVIDGKPLSTGKFLRVDEPDFATPFSGAFPGPPFPGEDFLVNAPDGLSFPLDLSGNITAITVEPFPDNSPAPFSLKPLVHTIPNNADFHTGYTMDNDAENTNPTGRISIFTK